LRLRDHEGVAVGVEQTSFTLGVRRHSRHDARQQFRGVRDLGVGAEVLAVVS